MAWTFQIEDATTSLNLNDGTSFKVMPGGFGAPSPSLRATYAGDGNLFRSGSRLVRQSYNNRIVTLGLQVIGTSTDVLASNIESLETYLRAAQEFSSFASGSQVKLRYQWDSATSPVFFHVLTGTFDAIDAAQHTSMLTLNTRLANARLTLVCEPFAYGAQEVIENYVLDPSFEVAGTALADWTESKTATGTTARSTAQAKFGDASLLLTMTNSGGSGQVIERNQTLADVDAGETWSFEAWAYVTALSNCKAGLVLLYNDGSATTATSYITSTNSGFVQMTLANQTPPSGATQVIIKLRLEATASSATGTAYFDAVTAVADSAIPTTWVSSRSVGTIFTDASQATTNYLDVYNVPGNQPALLQLKAAENEAHTKFWMGARHNGRLGDAGLWHEGEGFTGLVDFTDANSSAGKSGHAHLWAVTNAGTSSGGASAATTLTTAHTVQTTHPDRLLMATVVCVDASETTPSSVTYNSVAMTQVGSTVTNTNSISMWRLVAPATGANNVVVTFASAVDHMDMGIADFYGVDQTTPLGTSASATGSSSSPSVNVTAAINDIVYAGVVVHDAAGSLSPGSGQTELSESSQITLSETTSWERAASTTVTMNHTTGNAAWATIGVPIKPVAQGSTSLTPTAALPYVATQSISTPPRGLYRVLIRASEHGTAPDIRVGVGYSTGAITLTPSTANDYAALSGSAKHIVDIGTLTLPPIATPENVTIGAFTIRLAMYDVDGGSNEDGYIQVDWVMLVPIDFGSLYLSKTSGTDVILSDSISDLRTAAILNTSDVLQSIPSTQGGDPPTVHPDGTRLYFLADDGAADTDHGWTMAVRVEPRFLSVAGT
jgi:hypothetical protein